MSDDTSDPNPPQERVNAFTDTIPKRESWAFDYNQPATRMFGCAVNPCPDNPQVVILEWPHLEAMLSDFPKIKADKDRQAEACVQFMGLLEGAYLRLFSVQAPLLMVTITERERGFLSEEINAVKADLFNRRLLGAGNDLDKHHGIMLEFTKIAAQIERIGPDDNSKLRPLQDYFDDMRSSILNRVSQRHLAGTDAH